jgi:Domain of unknown function (DUF4386)
MGIAMAKRTVSMLPQHYARLCGGLYLYIIVAGIFAELFVRSRLVVPTDAAATATNIMANESLFRIGFSGELRLFADADYLKTFPADQLHTIALLALKLHDDGYAICLLFFGFACLSLGSLVFRSRFLPRTIGALMALAECAT